MIITVRRQRELRIAYSDIISLISKRSNEQSAFWLANRDTISSLLMMVSASGDPVFNWGDRVSGDTLLGRAIYFSDDMPSIGECGDIMLIEANFKVENGITNMETISSIVLDKG